MFSTRQGTPNLTSPLHRMHPLARGLQAMWIVLPGMGGSKLWDIAGLPPHHGTWNSVTTTTGWRGTTRPGGFGHLVFDGATSNSYVDAGVWSDKYPSPYLWPGLTLSCWILMRANAAAFDTFFAKSENGNNNDLLINADSTISWYKSISGVNLVTSTTALATYKWYHICGTMLSIPGTLATLSLYINGKLEAASNFSDVGGHTIGAGTWRLGNSAVFGRPFNGFLDDARVYERALSATEVYALYQNSIAGYPGFINRIGMPLPATVAVAGKQSWWAWDQFGHPAQGF